MATGSGGGGDSGLWAFLLILGAAIIGSVAFMKMVGQPCPVCSNAVLPGTNPCPHCKSTLVWQTPASR